MTPLGNALIVPSRTDYVRRSALVAFGVLGALLLSYVFWLIVHPGFQYSVTFNGWLPDGFEFLVAMLCIARGFVRQPGRGIAIALGCALLSWCLGDTIGTVQSAVGRTSVTNVLGATFWLGFYPLAYVALVLFMRGKLRALSTPSWLDGAVAALGTSAVCAAFAFHGLERSISTNTLTTATNLAYPIGDLVLLALVVGGTAMLSRRNTAPWIVFATACVLNCIGDTFNLFQSTEGHLRMDAVFHAIAWPASGLLMAVAMWLRPRPAELLGRQKSVGFYLPGLAAACGLIVLIAGTMNHVGRIGLALAIASLVAAGARLV